MLNSRVTLRRATGGTDDTGQPLAGTVDIDTVWAEIRFLSGIETLRAGTEVSTAKASIKIRLRSDIVPGMQAAYGSTVFNIQSVLPDLVGAQFMFLACEVSS